MAKGQSFACYFFAGLLLVAATIGAAAAKPAHHGHAHRHGHNGLQSQQAAPPSVANSAVNHGSGNGAVKPENQAPGAPPANDHDTGTASRNTGPDQNSAGPEGKQNTQNTKGEGPSASTVETAVGSPGKAANSPDIHMNDLGAVDTHITVQPRLHAANRHDTGERKGKTKPHALTFLHPQPQFVHRHADEAIHNAIGVSIPPPHDAPRAGQATDARPHAASLTTVPSSHEGGADTSKTVVNPARSASVQPNQGAATPAPLTAPGTINGSGFRRRGFVPATLGGQIKTVAGLSGSMIHPKH